MRTVGGGDVRGAPAAAALCAAVVILAILPFVATAGRSDRRLRVRMRWGAPRAAQRIFKYLKTRPEWNGVSMGGGVAW